MPLLSNYYLLSVVLGHCGVGRVTTRLCSSQVLCSITKMSRRLHKCKAVISNHTSRYTMAHGSTWEEGGSSGNVHTRGLLSREIFKCEAGWPSLAHPLWPWDSSFLLTSQVERGALRRPHRTYTYTQAMFPRAGRTPPEAPGVRAKLTHALTSFPTSLSGIPVVLLLCKLVVGSTANQGCRPNASGYWEFFRNTLLW